jgi:multisubunit Na+/H+ antiporter MnhF subunit
MNRLQRMWRRLRGDAGMTTAEYAVGTIAAVAFAAVLYRVVQSPAVRDALTAIIDSALHVSL